MAQKIVQKSKSSTEYWRKREEKNLKKNLLTEEEYVQHVHDILDYTVDQIQKEINGFYTKYARQEGISLAEAKRRIKSADVEEFARKAKKYVKEKNFSKQANEEMRLYNATMKINRLELLKANIGLELVSGFDELQKYNEEILTDRTKEELERQAGILGGTVQNNEKMVSSIVNGSFHNATYSERIWLYQDMMRNELDKLLRQGLIQGKNPRQLATHLQKLFGTCKYVAERLMRTELARVQIDAQKQSFEKNGYEQYTFLSLGSACGSCKALNGKHFDVSKMMPGDNAPPIHPNCRCSVSAYIDEDSYNEWLDTYKAHGLGYEEWKRERLIKNVELPKELQETKKISEDIKAKISETIDKITEEYGVDMKEIEYAPFTENPKAPFSFIPYSDDGKYKAKLNVNSLFDWNESLEAFNARIYNKNYTKGILASKDLEDLIYHEAAHFMTFDDCVTFGDYILKEEDVRDEYVLGVSGYSDASYDGAETIAEGFVRRKNGEKIDESVEALLQKFIRRR